MCISNKYSINMSAYTMEDCFFISFFCELEAISLRDTERFDILITKQPGSRLEAAMGKAKGRNRFVL